MDITEIYALAKILGFPASFEEFERLFNTAKNEAKESQMKKPAKSAVNYGHLM